MRLSPVSFSFGSLALLGLVALLSGPGCVDSSSNSGAGGTTSETGGTTSASGGSTATTSAGGTTASTAGGSGSGAAPQACLPVREVISDFTYTVGGSTSTSDGAFGDYTTYYSGGTFVYPASATALTQDVTQSNWHIKGSATDYAGFGLYNGGGCSKIDASAYKGISFVVSGTIASGVAATENTLTLTVGTAADDITSAWLNANKAAGTADVYTFGGCTPASSNRYDGTCAAPQKAGLPVTTTPTKVTVLWTELLGGKPQASVNPAEITFITWVLPNPTGVGTTSVVPYPVDVVIDDIQFVP